jgi:hypothetical protein
VVTAIIARIGGTAHRSEVARLVERLNEGRPGNLAGVLAQPITEQGEGEAAAIQKWIFAPEPARRLH